MRLLLLVMSDGRREYLERTMLSLGGILADVEHWVIHEDSGDPADAKWAAGKFPGWRVHATGARSGFGGAIRSAWDLIRADYPDATHVLHWEGDFTLNRPVEVRDMCAVLDDRPHLAQMALRRQAWNAEEIAAGGIIERWPGDFIEIKYGHTVWLEHRRWFTTNPCVYRAGLLDGGWPDGAESEGHFSAEVFADTEMRAGYWGARDEAPWVHHIGDIRAGTEY